MRSTGIAAIRQPLDGPGWAGPDPSRMALQQVIHHLAIRTYPTSGRRLRGRDVCKGSWLCKNAKRLKRDRINYSSKTALVVQHAIEFNLKVELKKIILVAFRYFKFLHSQGQTENNSGCANVFWVIPESRHCSRQWALRICANRRHSANSRRQQDLPTGSRQLRKGYRRRRLRS
jgi:hypothetical protein